MLDLQRIKRLEKHPRLEDLVFLYDCYTQLTRLTNASDVTKSKKAPTLAEVCESLGGNRQHFYHRLKRLRQLLPEPMFDTTPGMGTRLEESESFARLERLLKAYEELWLGDTPENPASVSLGAPQILSARCLPLPLNLFRSKDCRDHSDEVSINLACDTPNSLRSMVREGEIDYSLTSCPEGYEGDDNVAIVSSAELHRCLLCPSTHRFARRQPSQFSWKELRDETVVIYKNPEAAPDFPWSEVVDHAARTIAVETTIEAHGYVLAGGAIAFSYKELLSQEEEKHLGILDLPSNAPATTRINLLRSEAAAMRWPTAKRDLMRELESRIGRHLTDMGARLVTSQTLSDTVAEFQSLWFSRHDPNARRKALRWTPATIRDLRVTPSGYLRGTVCREFADESEPWKESLELVGRVKIDGSMAHLVCRAVLADQKREKHGTAEFLYSKDDLKGEFLVGTFSETSSETGLQHGLLIAHTKSIDEIDDVAELSSCVSQFGARGQRHSWVKAWKCPKSIEFGVWSRADSFRR